MYYTNVATVENSVLYILGKWDDLHSLVEKKKKTTRKNKRIVKGNVQFRQNMKRKKKCLQNNTFAYVFRKVIFIFVYIYIRTIYIYLFMRVYIII